MSKQFKNIFPSLSLTPGELILLVSIIVAALDQATKIAIVEILSLHSDKVIIDGFFKLVYWGNTGAAWSLFRDNNELLTVVSLIALLFLFIIRDKFEIQTTMGQVAMGMIFGGIIGNIVDRLLRGHVVDFLYFYVVQRSGKELGFPAFNIADLSICIGVGLMLVLMFIKNNETKTLLNPEIDEQSKNPEIINKTEISSGGISHDSTSNQ